MWGKMKSRFVPLTAAFLSVLLLSSILPVNQRWIESLGGNYDAYPEYLQAIEDAKVAAQDEISKNLVAIVKNNDNLELQWEGEAGKSRVLVITWTNKSYYDDYVGKDYQLPEDANIWVTAVPELKNFIQNNSGNITALRIEQLLGLPPEGGKTKFIEMWVNPGDMFRPSPDPEITDHEAEITFPTVLNRFLTFDNRVHIVEYDGDKQADVSYAYREWFRHRRQTIYSGDYPYPWTRLGYTYDWGNTSSHAGLSEFVIMGSSTVGINSIISNDDYFKGLNH
ncbi:MAG TPA: hypothetical protein ACFYEK_04050 [Candidatus Wunengus sp. YC60]|uniref:hypothetical protein n=1 Tax=Candidatus Wunengus sp. YC60 TaxID=3367697 RepID=UPI0040263B00